MKLKSKLGIIFVLIALSPFILGMGFILVKTRATIARNAEGYLSEYTGNIAADIGDAQASTGDRLADRVAAVGGSWGFIIVFTLVLLGWMLLNSEVLQRFGLAFDPYPFIFLNLMLSTLAAVQAPIIMMSQNRQSAKDRLTASVDYEINLRAELEIMRLHEKLDQMRIGELAVKVDELCARMDGKGVS